MNNILVPTDFTTNTDSTLDWARLFARKTGATITLLHVFQPMIPDSTLPSIGATSDIGVGLAASHDLEQISRDGLDRLTGRLTTEGFSVRSEWRMGTVEDEILASADEFGADLIIIGRSNVSTFFDRIAGSAAADVATDAVCPVLIVPGPNEGGLTRPAQVRTIAYAMQPKTTQSDVTTQTGSLVDAFDAQLTVLTGDQLDKTTADLLVMQYVPQSGFLDGLLHPNPANKLVQNADVPVLVYHMPKA